MDEKNPLAARSAIIVAAVREIKKTQEVSERWR